MKIKQAEKQAQELISRLSPEIVERLGMANLLSDITHELLLGASVEEIQRKLACPDDESLLGNRIPRSF